MKKIMTASLALVTFIALLGVMTPSVSSAAPSSKNAKSYWTLEKLKKAKPFEMIFDGKSKIGKRVTLPAVQKPSPPDSNVVTGLPWKDGGVPESSTGKVFFSIGSIGYTCSGALVKEADTARAIVLTAGHCAYDQKPEGTGDYVKNWIFIPNYEKVGFPAEGCALSDICWAADALTVDLIFKGEPGFTDTATAHDWGFATIKSSAGSVLPDEGITGLYPLKVSDEAFSSPSNLLGYSFGFPAQGKFKGNDLIYCKGDVFPDTLNNSTTWGMRCDMTGGASGGPWVSRYNTTDVGLGSVNSYKYISDRKRMYGPKFTIGTSATFAEALAQ
jgi:hypothetical protein